MSNRPPFLIPTLLLAALFAVQLPGCGESNDTVEPPAPTPTPAPAPEPEPTPTPVGDGAAAEAAFFEMMSIACEKIVACPAPDDDLPFETVEECIAMFDQAIAELDLAAGVDAGELEFDPAVAATCLEDLPAALEAQSCQEFLDSEAPPVAECETLLNGLFPEEEGGGDN